MRSKWIMAAAGMLVCTAATSLHAQGGQGVAIVPLAGFNIPGMLAEEDGGYEFKAKGAPLFGLQIELGLSKNMSFGVGGSMSIGQSLDLSDNSAGGAGTFGSADISSPRVYGVLSIRPGGRRPNGAVTPLAIELGGGITMWSFKEFTVDTDGDGVQETNIPVTDWDGSEPFAFGGIAYNVPIGPRSSIQLFGRAVVGFGYSSDGLDSFNAAPPTTNVEGTTNIGFIVGAGLRVGR